MYFYEQLETVHAVPFLGTFAKLQKATISFVIPVRLSVSPSVCSPGKPRLPLDGFICQFIFVYFFNICREISSSITIRQT